LKERKIALFVRLSNYQGDIPIACPPCQEQPGLLSPQYRSIARFSCSIGRKIMFDSDLAAIYGVRTGNLTQAVSHNSEVKQIKALPAPRKRRIGF
jgi:hypothetical protein